MQSSQTLLSPGIEIAHIQTYGKTRMKCNGLDEICCFTSTPQGTPLMPPTTPFMQEMQHIQHIAA